MPPPVWSPYYRPGVRKPDASLNRFAASKAAITGDVSVRRANARHNRERSFPTADNLILSAYLYPSWPQR
jgi:hypothetical protein